MAETPAELAASLPAYQSCSPVRKRSLSTTTPRSPSAGRAWHCWLTPARPAIPPSWCRCLAIDQPPEVSSAAADCLARLADAELAEQLFAGWNGYTCRHPPGAGQPPPSVRRRPPRRCVAAIEAGTIVPLELEAAVRDVLVQLPDEALRDAGDQGAGRRDSRRSAASVGRLRRRRRSGRPTAGTAGPWWRSTASPAIKSRAAARIGPDLSGIGSQPKEQLLVSLLDPSRQVSPDFLAYTLITGDGQVLSGLVASETAGSVTLRRAEGSDEIVPRANIEVAEGQPANR